MRQDSPRWTEFDRSEFEHERDGLRLVAEYLPDADPYHVWSNAEFIAGDGSVNEVDALVLTPAGLCILELKHWYGEIDGGAQDRLWQQRANPHGRLVPHLNPIFLANRKAKRLAGMVRQLAMPHDQDLPIYVESAIFLHAERTESHLTGSNAVDVYGRDGEQTGLRSLKDYLTTRPRYLSDDQARRLVALLSRSRLRPSIADRKVGTCLLHPKPFAEGVGWQDYLAGHTADKSLVRRVRIYLTGGRPADETAAIRRAAEREFRLLQGIHHPGIPQALDVVQDHPWGTAVIFDHDKDLERLDHWLVRNDHTMKLTERLQLVQQLAETIGYAHSRHLMHRALHPGAVYVQDRPEGRALVVTNWQTGGRLPNSSTVTRLSSSSDSANLDLFFTDELRRYQAPEASRGGKGTALDVFSLGSIAYRIFTGADPATSAAELTSRVRESGLSMAASADALPEPLVQLVYDATRGDPGQRLAGVAEFRSGLDEVWKRISEPDPEPEVDPLAAHKGDVLPGGFRVEARLGSGSTATALLVKSDRYPQDVVLKVARSEAAETRLAEEAAKLARLGGQWIAALKEPEPIRIGQRLALVLEYAGKPLTEELRRRLDLEHLDRYGRDLLEILVYLDGQAVWHRDLKPANLATRPRPKDRQPHLCVFDFSLAGVPDTDLAAGTVHYLDPFLGTGGRDRYDSAAERFAAAVTLYEMATGRLPRWGADADPRAISDEVSLPESAFDPAIADRLVTFFGHALARDVADRFGTAEQMLDAWREIFRNIPHDSAAGQDELTLDAPLSRAGLTPRARSALERLHHQTIGDLLDAKPSELTAAPGVTNATRREIIAKQKALRALLAPDEPEPDADAVSIEELCDRLLPKNSTQPGKSDALRVLLGQAPDRNGTFLHWPSQNDVAARCNTSQSNISNWLRERRRVWLKSLVGIRVEISELLADNGGVMSANELAAALMAAHGTYTPEPRRTAQAVGLLRATVEVENDQGGNARFATRRSHSTGLVLVGSEPNDPDSTDTAEAALKAADALGKAAAQLVPLDAGADEPLPSRQAALEELRTVKLPPTMVLSDERLLRLAAVASHGLVDANAQGQLYPVGMPPVRTVRLCAESLAGQRMSVDAVKKRVAARFPRAATLPDRPELDDLLLQVPLIFDRTERRYVSPTIESLSTGSTRTAPAYGAAVPARQIDEAGDRISEALDHRRYLALLTPPRALTATRRALLDRYGLTEVDVTALLLDTLRGLRIEGADWPLIVAADTGEPGDPDYRELVGLVRHHVLPAVHAALEAPEPVLITEAAPLARYGLLGPITALTDPTQPRPAARLLLAAAHTYEPPMLDRTPVPHTTHSQVLWLDAVWATRTTERIDAR